MTALQRWLLALAAVAVTVTICYLWIDRPVALFAYGRFHVPHRQTLEPLTHVPDPLIPAAVIAFVATGLWALSGRALARFPAVVAVGSLSLTMAAAFKNQLKFVFGRTWPSTTTLPLFITASTASTGSTVGTRISPFPLGI